MSDTAVFIVVSSDELRASGQLPGDLRSLRALAPDGDRIVHLEILADAPLPERALNGLHLAGARITILPSAPDAASALVGGLMARLHEFTYAFPHIAQFLLAGANTDRLFSAATFLQNAGFGVILCGPDRAKLESVRFAVDEIGVWSGRGSSRLEAAREPREPREAREPREPREARVETPAPDAYEVLVDEVTKGRQGGHRVLLTSLKQRMRKRIRRFDETRMKDKDGRPMRKFKDFIVDAAARRLIQLVERGNLSHVLLPGEALPSEDENETDDIERDENGDAGNDDESPADIEGVDPLLDAVDMIDDDSGSDEGEDADDSDSADADEPDAPPAPVEEEQDEPAPREEDFDVDQIDEEANPPPAWFMELLESSIPRDGAPLGDILRTLAQKQAAGELPLNNRATREALQNAFHNELIESIGDEKPARFVVVDDWRGIIDFL